eukprot:CAMPEP_0197702384 /NCGR_PEP_ID=MMETSP1338-20131121/124449_1 /TAXON_ID=43686 ORGANISM="Pelagodinium beii, Strain RCC1491" /NCGR_SAMPLE_ID=MMETSP1338 /ASSEMBLY_ACC=CAM_ASM_000754 /LENGTH=57 /DNA_ID=CAMNT_0043286213 /DNA_START=224 /DNA_END=397 /DNA_ORIENTATION=-
MSIKLGLEIALLCFLWGACGHNQPQNAVAQGGTNGTVVIGQPVGVRANEMELSSAGK